MGRRSWTPEEEQKLIELWKHTTFSYEQIADELNRSLASIQCKIGQLREAGMLEYSKSRKRWTPEEEEYLVELHNNTSLSCRQIADELGRSYSSVRNRIWRLLKKGIFLKEKEGSRWTSEEEEELIRLYNNSTFTYERIADELERSYNCIQTKIRKLLKKGILKERWRLWTAKEEKQLVKWYTTTSFSCKQIADELGRSSGSVESRVRKLRKAGIVGYRKPETQRKYKKDLSNVEQLTPEGAYFITSVLGDGYLLERRVQFAFRKRDCFEFRDIMCHILTITPPLHIGWSSHGYKSKPGVLGTFNIYSVELADLLAYTYGVPMGAKSGLVRLPRLIMKAVDPKLHGAVLRAAYECEGGVNLRTKSLCVIIGNTSILFLQDLAEILGRYTIENTIYGYRLHISSLESVVMFYEQAYSVFDLKLHVTAKKKGLETLIKRKAKKCPHRRRNVQ